MVDGTYPSYLATPEVISTTAFVTRPKLFETVAGGSADFVTSKRQQFRHADC